MPLTCPNCNSRSLRYARVRGFAERFWTCFGIRPLRCRDCHTRFIERTWRLRHIRFARCPRCWRMDLSRWTPADYRISATTWLLLALGGQPYRCEYCRVNFVSFRKRKERYRARRRKQASATPESPDRQPEIVFTTETQRRRETSI
jgi:hypothetical protein